MSGQQGETMSALVRLIVWQTLVVYAAITWVVPATAQTNSPHNHESIGWVPREILERPVPLRKNIGNLHEPVTTSSPQAQAFYDQGLDYLHSYQWIEAVRSFQQALRLDPTLAMAHIGLSDAYAALQDNQAALAAFEKAKALVAHTTPREQTRIEIRGAQMDFIVDPGADLRKYFAVRKAVSDALVASPADPWLWILRGITDEGNTMAHGQGGGVDTIAFYEAALAASPDNSAAHHYLAHTFENLGRIEEALEQTDAFLRLASAIPHAHHMRGHELRRLGRTQEAIQEFLETDKLETAYYQVEHVSPKYDWHHAHNLSLLALCYESQGQMKAAERLLREAFALPVYTDISEFNHREWPAFLMDRGRLEEALQAAQEMVEKSKWPMGRFAAHTLAGRGLLSMDRLDDARQELSLAEHELAEVPASTLAALPDVGVLRAEISLREHRWAEADASLKQIEQAIRAMPGPDSWAEALFELQSIARSAQQVGDWDLAEFTAKQMVEHDPSYPGGYYALGLAAEHRADPALAREQFLTAQKLWSAADSDLAELTQLRQKLGAPMDRSGRNSGQNSGEKSQ